jgi:hypothetical protein
LGVDLRELDSPIATGSFVALLPPRTKMLAAARRRSQLQFPRARVYPSARAQADLAC